MNMLHPREQGLKDTVSDRKRAIVNMELIQKLFGYKYNSVRSNFVYHGKKLSNTDDVVWYIKKEYGRTNQTIKTDK